jgi:RNA polymerase sigma-70 factor (ECF subfamily)
MTAVAAGSPEQLTSIFRSDVQLVSDGGGKRPAALRVLNNPQEVAQVILHLATAKGGPQQIRPVTLNGAPAVWLRDAQGFETTMQLEIVDEQVKAIFIVRNPDKLAHLRLQA